MSLQRFSVVKLGPSHSDISEFLYIMKIKKRRHPTYSGSSHGEDPWLEWETHFL
jgi:hypothetical protein